MTFILRVAVPTILRQTFDYLAPSSCEKKQSQPGIRVIVPFGNRKLVGIVLEIVEAKQSQVPIEKLKSILEI